MSLVGINAIRAVCHVRRMRGGTQSQLMRCEDGSSYVVKFRNNPQHLRVLANEYVAGQLAAQIGLSVAKVGVIFVGADIVNSIPEMYIELRKRLVRCASGFNFGSKVPASILDIRECLTEAELGSVSNIREFPGMLAFDIWTCNTDRRQVVFFKNKDKASFSSVFIDNGHCFGGPEWSLPKGISHGSYRSKMVYADVTGWESFEPWLTRIEEFSLAKLGNTRAEMPRAWCDDIDRFDRVLERLWKRRTRVRDEIKSLRDAGWQLFPKWHSDCRRAASRSTTAVGVR